VRSGGCCSGMPGLAGPTIRRLPRKAALTSGLRSTARAQMPNGKPIIQPGDHGNKANIAAVTAQKYESRIIMRTAPISRKALAVNDKAKTGIAACLLGTCQWPSRVLDKMIAQITATIADRNKPTAGD